MSHPACEVCCFSLPDSLSEFGKDYLLAMCDAELWEVDLLALQDPFYQERGHQWKEQKRDELLGEFKSEGKAK